MREVLRLCLDLNVWCAQYLALKKGRTGTAAQMLVDAVRHGECSLGETQLVISWGMLNRLRKVWEHDWGVPAEDAAAAITSITDLAGMGAQRESPYLLLGGTGVVPLHDEEDAHVLDVAVSGRADLLVTMNFKDFITRKTDVRQQDRIAIHSTADAEVVIVHPFTAADWLRQGRIEIP